MKPLTIHFYTAFVHEQGTYFRFHNLARGLAALGQNVTVFACDQNRRSRPRTENRDGIEYQILPVSAAARVFDIACDPITAGRNALVRRPACDIAHLFQPFPTAALAWRRAEARAHFWDWDDLWTHENSRRPLRPLREHWSKPVIRYMEKTLPRTADHVTVIDAFLGDLARSRDANRVSLLYNPSPTFPAEGKAEIRRRLGLNPNAFYVGFMGFTTAEMEWCLTAVAQNSRAFPALRFAVCGPDKGALGPLPAELESRMDALGRLSQSEARHFAAALDLALLPLEDNSFNRSRFPVKFSEYLMAGTPVLCSEIGECAKLAPSMPWVLGAGTTRQGWLDAFPGAVKAVQQGSVPAVNKEAVHKLFSEHTVCCGLLAAYRTELDD